MHIYFNQLSKKKQSEAQDQLQTVTGQQSTTATDGMTRAGGPRVMKPGSWREYAQKRRKIADKQIIACIVMSGLLVIGIGIGLTCVAIFVLGKDDPLILIGPVLGGCGIIVLLLSIEVCVRRHKLLKLSLDDSDDEADHYIDEGLVNYGYGHYGSNDELPAVKFSNQVAPSTRPVDNHDNYKPSFEDASRPRSGKDFPHVEVSPASPFKGNDIAPSQENIELLLSPTKLGK